MRAAVHSKCMVRLADAKLLEKDIGHIAVEMLAGVDQDLDKAIALRNRRGQRRGLYELGPSADD